MIHSTQGNPPRNGFKKQRWRINGNGRVKAQIWIPLKYKGQEMWEPSSTPQSKLSSLNDRSTFRWLVSKTGGQERRPPTVRSFCYMLCVLQQKNNLLIFLINKKNLTYLLNNWVTFCSQNVSKASKIHKGINLLLWQYAEKRLIRTDILTNLSFKIQGLPKVLIPMGHVYNLSFYNHNYKDNFLLGLYVIDQNKVVDNCEKESKRDKVQSVFFLQIIKESFISLLVPQFVYLLTFY